MITRSGYHLFEYTSKTADPKRSSESNLTETIISVFFDRNAQKLFSRVWIHIGHEVGTNRSLATCIANKWKVARGPLVIDRTSSAPLEAEAIGSNTSSLPILDLYYLKSLEDGALTLEDSSARLEQPLLEIDEPLAADMLSVSVSIMTTPYISSLAHKKRNNHALDDTPWPSTITRVLRIQLPTNKTNRLPTEVLHIVFEILLDICSPTLWRRTLFSCGRVCRGWLLAFNIMLEDFRYPVTRIQDLEYPPEIASFAKVLAERPTLALSIECVSAHYLLKHKRYKNLGFILANSCERLFRPRREWEPSSDARRHEFIESFLTILQHAKNVRAIFLPLYLNQDMPRNYLEALRKLDKIEKAEVTGELSAVHEYLAMWSSLKHLTITSWQQPEPRSILERPPQYSLTHASLIALNDQALHYVLSASSSSLESLDIINPNRLTRTGLRSALRGVCSSLVALHIGEGVTKLIPNSEANDREHAMDGLIDHMNRLEFLAITPDNATRQMLERRADAFVKKSLPVVDLRLEILQSSQDNGLREAADQNWTGWEIEVVQMES